MCLRKGRGSLQPLKDFTLAVGWNIQSIITSRVCGRGNVFLLSMCLPVCMSVLAIIFDVVDVETSFFWYFSTS